VYIQPDGKNIGAAKLLRTDDYHQKGGIRRKNAAVKTRRRNLELALQADKSDINPYS
jgi:hypothetical protein